MIEDINIKSWSNATELFRNIAELIESAALETIEEPIPRQKQGELPTEEIVQMAREQGKTQGRKRVRGETITGFVNHLIEKCIDENQEVYQKALEFRNKM